MALPGVLVAGIPGAGGYDGVFALVIGDATCDAVDRFWSERGTLALSVRETHGGIQLEPTQSLDMEEAG